METSCYAVSSSVPPLPLLRQLIGKERTGLRQYAEQTIQRLSRFIRRPAFADHHGIGDVAGREIRHHIGAFADTDLICLADVDVSGSVGLNPHATSPRASFSQRVVRDQDDAVPARA